MKINKSKFLLNSLAFVSIICLLACAENTSPEKQRIIDSIEKADNVKRAAYDSIEKADKLNDSIAKAAKEAPKNWSYKEDVDKMTNVKNYYAVCVSTNKIDFEFPYEGGSSFALSVRQMGEGNEIILQVLKGQFMTSTGESEYIKARFDNEQPLKFSFNSAEDGSSNIIFLNNSVKFLSKLKTTKKLLIEAPFYNAGRKVIEFNVEGLKWDK